MTISEKVIKWKLEDARRVVKERKMIHTQQWREDEAVLREYNVRDRFLEFWEVEKCERRIELNRKKEKKILFLVEKRRKERSERQRREDVDTVRGINVCDKLLSEVYESEPRCYGGAEVSSDEKAVLELTPRFAVYERVDFRQ